MKKIENETVKNKNNPIKKRRLLPIFKFIYNSKYLKLDFKFKLI